MATDQLSRVEILCKDRDVGQVQRLLVGLALELKSQPVVNAVAGPNGILARSSGSMCDLFLVFCQGLVNSGTTELTPTMIRSFLQQHNFRAKSLTYALKCGESYLKRRGTGNKRTYVITLPSTKGAKKRPKGGK